MSSISLKVAIVWSAILLLLALARVHFRVVTTNVAYNLGKLKGEESNLLEQRSVLQAEFAKISNKKNLQTLSGSQDIAIGPKNNPPAQKRTTQH
ncbi:MAG: hypothetical protein NT027_10305 [Proteobacteria bacterium]|nr:hypothetical protein [Pseudomonadota bacterium]